MNFPCNGLPARARCIGSFKFRNVKSCSGRRVHPFLVTHANRSSTKNDISEMELVYFAMSPVTCRQLSDCIILFYSTFFCT